LKILAFSYFFPPVVKGGAEISTYYILKGLLNYGCEIKLVTGTEVSPKNKEFDVLIPKSFCFPSRIHFIFEFFTPKRVAKEILSELKIEKFDIVHAHDIYSLLILGQIKAFLLKRTNTTPKFIFTVRDYLPICAFGNLLTKKENILCNGCRINRLFNCVSFKEKKFFLKLAGPILPHLVKIRKASLESMDAIIYISYYLETEFQKRINYRNQTKVIYNPLPQGYFKKFSQPKQKDMILYVGRIEHYKGVGLFLKVLREILSIFPDLKVYFVGEGRDKNKYSQLVNKWGLDKSIHFTGWLSSDDLKLLYEKASILVVPSVWPEPFGRVVIEGMANKCLIIGSNAGSLPELIKDGYNGYLFQHNDEIHLFKKLKFLLENQEKLQSVRENAFQFAHKFENSKISREYLNFYEKLIMR